MIPDYKNFSLENIVREIDGVIYTEHWRTVSEDTKYLVSSFGRIKKCGRMNFNNTKWLPEKIMTLGKTKKGYLRILLRGEKKLNRYVHRLVGIEFIDRTPGKDDINHKNGIKTDNHYTQIEWCTKQENNEHGVLLGLLKRGRNPKPYIRKGYAKGVKKIINIETNEVLEHALALKQKTGWSLKKIRRMLSGVRYNKTSYRYLGEENKILLPPQKVKSPIAVFNLSDELVKTFDYSSDASKFIGETHSSMINKFMKGENSHVKGYKFKRIASDGSYIEPIPFVSKKPPLKPKIVRGQVTPSKEVIKFNLTGDEVERYNSIGLAAKENGADKGYFKKVLKSPTNYYRGFIYKVA